MPEAHISETEATPQGQAPAAPGPRLDYNVPQQIAYSGQNYIELKVDPTDFRATRAGTQAGEKGP
jgi:hypothetical protein